MTSPLFLCMFCSLVADSIIFNSNFNKTSFLNHINGFLNIQPDFKLKHIKEKIEPKSAVIHYPIRFNRMPKRKENSCSQPLHFIWPHRWEHDKNPQLLIDTLLELNNNSVPFRVSIIGESFEETPKCFDGIGSKLGEKLLHFGFLSRDDYIECLLKGDIVISTADHEFFGVSM